MKIKILWMKIGKLILRLEKREVCIYNTDIHKDFKGLQNISAYFNK